MDKIKLTQQLSVYNPKTKLNQQASTGCRAEICKHIHILFI